MTPVPGADRAPFRAAGNTRFSALGGPEDVLYLLRPHFSGLAYEKVLALFLDERGSLCGMGAWEGHEAHVDLPVRRILAAALATDTAAMVLAHNHPSGDANPSVQDVRTTRNLARLCSAIGIRLLDHVILCGERTASMRSLRLI